MELSFFSLIITALVAAVVASSDESTSGIACVWGLGMMLVVAATIIVWKE